MTWEGHASDFIGAIRKARKYGKCTLQDGKSGSCGKQKSVQVHGGAEAIVGEAWVAELLRGLL
jgi:hypothetical protein